MMEIYTGDMAFLCWNGPQSLAPGKCPCNYELVVFEHILYIVIDALYIAFKIYPPSPVDVTGLDQSSVTRETHGVIKT